MEEMGEEREGGMQQGGGWGQKNGWLMVAEASVDMAGRTEGWAQAKQQMHVLVWGCVFGLNTLGEGFG